MLLNSGVNLDPHKGQRMDAFFYPMIFILNDIEKEFIIINILRSENKCQLSYYSILKCLN